ncbi:MAG: DNA polymerase III subunit beta [bacterium]|nr:DNA polymerase III subunit beta [bacterium]
MRFTVDRKQFADALTLAQSAVAAKSTLAILGNALISAEGDKVQITGTNIDLWARSSIPGAVAEGGELTLPAKKLTDIVRALSSDEVEVTVDGMSATITGGRAHFKIMGMEAADFPTFPTVTGDKRVNLRQGDLKDYVRKTLFASSDDITRYALNGVCIQLEGNEMRFVATDGYRLAYAAAKMEVESGSGVDVILPSRAANELQKILGDDKSVEVVFAENHIAFDAEDFLLVTRRAEGKFPPYREVIPPAFSNQITIERETFFEAVKRVALISDEHSKQIVLNVENGEMNIEAKSTDVGEADEQIPVEYEGDAFKVSYNAAFLADILSSLEGEDLLYELNDPGKQGLFRSIGDEDHFCILMPIKV